MPRKKGVTKKPLLIHITAKAREGLNRLAEQRGLSLSSYVETLIRDEMERRGVIVEEDTSDE